MAFFNLNISVFLQLPVLTSHQMKYLKHNIWAVGLLYDNPTKSWLFPLDCVERENMPLRVWAEL